MWFEKLTGFREESVKKVQQNLVVEGDVLISKVNGKSFIFGTLDVSNLAELRRRVLAEKFKSETISVREVIANVQDLHCKASNGNSLFQVASQFNLLEMAAPTVIPERGVDIYEHDHTQGPACAIAAGAGTIYRNYFADVNRQTGQTFDRQIDCLFDIGTALGNTNSRLWEMKNGYA